MRKYGRDELGRFAPKYRPRRDELGRFTPKPVERKAVEKKPVERKVAERKPAKRKPAKRKPAKRKPAERKPAERKPTLPLVPAASGEAEAEMQARLLSLLEAVESVQGGLQISIKTFVNRDGTVDGELRIADLPRDWRGPGGARRLVAALSEALRAWGVFASKPAMGGAYWASFGVRFGPRTAAEMARLVKLYRRYRGMPQIGTYPTQAWGQGALQVALTSDVAGLRSMLESMLERRGLPPTEILIRFIWTPDGSRPAHYRGEK